MSEDQPVVIIIDDDPDIRGALQDLLNRRSAYRAVRYRLVNSWQASARRDRAVSSPTSDSRA
jgi:FixJ family two-component response regulator